MSTTASAVTRPTHAAQPIIKRRGLMFVLSSPSGAGKTSISRRLLSEDDNLNMSVSVTTRPQRPGERNGVDYHFISQARYDEMVAGDELLEHATVFDNTYGTPRKAVEAALAAGHDVLFDIDWQGTQQIKDKQAADVVSVFILPPSAAELERRLHSRAQDADSVIRRRMAKAADEISHFSDYDYLIVNHDLDDSVVQAQAILRAERSKRTRMTGVADFVNQLKRQL